jgi:hypothetical protein
MSRRWFAILSLAVLAASEAAHAAPLDPKKVPAALAPWIPWVLRGHEREGCPLVGGDDQVCAWSGRLTLSLDGKGGRFSQEWEVLAESEIGLPGDAQHWPLEVKAGGKPVPVVSDEEGRPAVALPPGHYTLAGLFQWRSLPESLRLPTETGLLALTVNGKGIDFPGRGDGGSVFLQKEASRTQNDSLQISVHRRVEDGIPLLLTTRITLEVAGKARELVLGKSLPAGFAPHTLESALPARLEPDGHLRVQARPGSWVITLVGRHDGPAPSLTRPAPEGPWKEGEEVWVFQAAPSLRVATVEGVPGVDPQQTTLPPEWKSLPAYVMAPAATMTLAEHRRGDANPAPDRLHLTRDLWLDFDGGGITTHDHIEGTFSESWRLSMGPSEKLGRVAIGDADQFITRFGPGGREGVEIRQGRADISAESRITGVPRSLLITGWDHDFQGMKASMNLPPGWKLLHASGADAVSASWLDAWTLLQLFLVLICAVATGKLFGPRAGALMLVGLGLTVTEPGAPEWVWLVVLVTEALARALDETRVGRLLRVLRLATWIALVLIAVPFAIGHLRAGLFPAQEDLGGPSYERESTVSYLSAPPPAAEEAAPEAPAPAKLQKMMASDSLADLGSIGAGGIAQTNLRSAHRAAPASSRAQAQNLSSYDPSVVVQTGPGLPRWRWRQVSFTWNGPVERDQRLSVWLLPPGLNTALALLRVALLALLVLLFVRRSRRLFSVFMAPAAALVLLLAGPRPAQAAEFPPDDLLEQLRQGLLQKPDCAPRCATAGRLALEAASDHLRLRLEISAAAATAVALPGSLAQWTPQTVTIDGKPSPALFRDEDGTLWVRLGPGQHQLLLDGPLPARDVVQIPLPDKPHAVSAAVRGWKLDGVGDDGEIADTLQLSREERGPRGGGASSDLGSSSLPPFVVVERRLLLGLKWMVETRVSRLTPPGTAVLLEVPLLPGESPLTEGLRVVGGKAQITMAPDAGETTWRSALEQRPALELVAVRAPSFTEVWTLDSSPLWHVEVSGIPPVLQETAAARVPRWQPWPGEKLSITVTRPGGTEGQTLTIERADLEVTPGARSTSVNLKLELHASRGGQHVITLPPGATLESLQVDDAVQPLRVENGKVTVPLQPKRQAVSLVYRHPAGMSAAFHVPVPDLGAPAVNVGTTVRVPGDRWVLLVGGPRLGPSVLFWSTALVIVLVGLGLGRATLTPLRARHWILLGLGLSQTPVPVIALVAGYFLALGVRARRPEVGRWTFALRQIALVIWTLVTVGILFAAVEEGLLARPDMHIAGNGSSLEFLRWFTDRAASLPPSPWVLSVPLLAYRLTMLAWALWLALSVFRWSRWAWRSFSVGGVWRTVRRPVLQAPPPSQPAA